jgi:hypothetical protein
MSKLVELVPLSGTSEVGNATKRSGPWLSANVVLTVLKSHAVVDIEMVSPRAMVENALAVLRSSMR